MLKISDVLGSNDSRKTIIKRGVIAAIAAVILIAMFNMKTHDIKNVAKDYEHENFCTVADDGSYVKIDTNPDDIEDYIAYGSNTAIITMNDKLGVPDYVYERMSNTRAIDGVQTYENDGLTVSWSYHPRSGLEVIYSAE